MHWLMDSSAGSVVFLGLVALMGFCLYFLPTMVAWVGHHPHFGWLVVLNIFFAWTVLGWVLLLTWALIQYDSLNFDQGKF